MAVNYGNTGNSQKSNKLIIYWLHTLGLFLWNNLLLIGLTLFFFYRTFMVGRLNWALLVLLVALCGFIICRILSFGKGEVTKFAYRMFMLGSTGLFISAVFIQTIRFIFVFRPGLTDATIPKLLVRAGIVTLVLYIFALILTATYYLYAHNMLKRLWNPWLPGLLETVFAKRNWQQLRGSTLILMNTLLWGGLATGLMLGIGFVAWLLR